MSQLKNKAGETLDQIVERLMSDEYWGYCEALQQGFITLKHPKTKKKVQVQITITENKEEFIGEPEHKYL